MPIDKSQIDEVLDAIELRGDIAANTPDPRTATAFGPDHRRRLVGGRGAAHHVTPPDKHV